jgi:adenylosuccinate synthase
MTARAVAVVDLGFGDAGKGLVVDFLARQPDTTLVVRFNGGAQAGHNVVTPDGRHHTFAQLGAGTFVPGVRTHLASRVVVHPTALLIEAARLREAGVADALERVSVSPDALLVTPFHQAACRIRELARGEQRHGSCGVGVGEVMADALRGEPIRARDLARRPHLRTLLAAIQERLRDGVREAREAAGRHAQGAAELHVLDDLDVGERWIEATEPFVARVATVPDGIVGDVLRRGERVVFEGAQGVLLDEDCGFHPYTTWSRCTFANVEELLAAHFPGGEPLFRLGVARIYAHRHGPGPLPTESTELGRALDEAHNVDGPWQGPFRVGWPDLVLCRYARAAAGPLDALALTHLDALPRVREWRMCAAYAPPHDDGAGRWPLLPPGDFDARAASTERLLMARPHFVAATTPRGLEEALGEAYETPVRLRASGPTWKDVRPAF